MKTQSTKSTTKEVVAKKPLSGGVADEIFTFDTGTATLPDLVAFYNRNSGSTTPVEKFKDLATGQKRVTDLINALKASDTSGRANAAKRADAEKAKADTEQLKADEAAKQKATDDAAKTAALLEKEAKKKADAAKRKAEFEAAAAERKAKREAQRVADKAAAEARKLKVQAELDKIQVELDKQKAEADKLKVAAIEAKKAESAAKVAKRKAEAAELKAKRDAAKAWKKEQGTLAKAAKVKAAEERKALKEQERLAREEAERQRRIDEINNDVKAGARGRVNAFSGKIIHKATPLVPLLDEAGQPVTKQGEPVDGEEPTAEPVMVHENPRRVGTWAWLSWKKLDSGMTYEEYIAAGGRYVDIDHDFQHGYVTVSDPVKAAEPETAAPEDQPTAD